MADLKQEPVKDEDASFKHENGYLYAFVEIPLAGTTIKGSDITFANGEKLSLTLEPEISEDGKTALILLNERQKCRRVGVDKADLGRMKAILARNGIGAATKTLRAASCFVALNAVDDRRSKINVASVKELPTKPIVVEGIR